VEHIGGITLHDLSSTAFWFGVFSIIIIDLVLSGDNAVLIALACRNLPKSLQTKGIVYGTVGAIVLRVTFATIMVYLLKIPFLKAIGGLLLVWIAVKLVIQEEEESDEVDAPEKLWAAVKTIIIADAIMSLDNIVAVAGAAQGKAALLWFGLAVSIPLVVYGSRILLILMERMPWIITIGAAILGWTAGHMIYGDERIIGYLGPTATSPIFLHGYLLPIIGAVGVVLIGMIMKRRRNGEASAVE